MFGCRGGAGIELYRGGRRRSIVRSNMTRTGAARAAATLVSPACGHDEGSSSRGSADPAAFDPKQLPLPTPVASARSATPLPRTTFAEITLPRGRQGGPGSVAFVAKVT